MKSLFLFLLLALSLLPAAEPTRAEREAHALASVMALPDGEKRDAGLKIVRAAWRQFHDDCVAARSTDPVPEERKARLADLAERNRSLTSLRTVADTEAHLVRWPLDDEARLILGRLHLEAGEVEAALRELLIVLALDPESAGGRELRGRIALAGLAAVSDPAERKQRSDSAAADLAPAITRLLAAGAAAESAGDAAALKTALGGLEALAAIITDPALAARLDAIRAAAAERAGELPRALALWERAAAAGVKEPDPAPHLRSLIRGLEADRVAPALAAGDLPALLRLSPSFPERDDLQDRLFRLLLSSGRLGDALAAARALLAAEPTHPLAKLVAEGCAAGLSPERLTRLPPILVALRATLPEMGLRFPVVHGLIAALTEMSGDPAAAAVALDPLLTLAPGDRAVRWQRARLRLAAGDHAGAVADCDAILAASADDADALEVRAQAKAAAGDKDGALADAGRLVALRPGTAALLSRARVRQGLKDRAGVLADLAAVVAAAKDVHDVAALLDAAGLAKACEDDAMQRSALERASKLGSAEALQRLKRLRTP